MPFALSRGVAFPHGNLPSTNDGGFIVSMPKYLESRLRAIAWYYDAMPNNSEITHIWDTFAAEIDTQFRSIPIPVEFVDVDPYKGSADMFAQVQLDNRLLIYKGGSDHPALSPLQNWQFRAVHDYYAHFLPQNSFSAMGEFRAWQTHMRMMGYHESRSALTCETLAQNAWYNFGPRSNEKPRPFAEQKCVWIPTSLWRDLQCID